MTTQAKGPGGPEVGASPEEQVRTVEMHAKFRHSAGRLGTHYLTVIRDEARLVGWRSGNPPLVQVPPKDLGVAGEWVDVGPGATLEAFAPADWVARPAGDDPAVSSLALVHIDGADTATLAWLRPVLSGPDALAPGVRLVACFADERSGMVTDFWFEPEAEAPHG